MNSLEFRAESPATGNFNVHNMQIPAGTTPFADLRGTLLVVLRLRSRVAQRLPEFGRSVTAARRGQAGASLHASRARAAPL